MKYAVLFLAIIAGVSIFWLTLSWAAGNTALTDGQYFGYPMIAAMFGFCLIGWAWERTRT